MRHECAGALFVLISVVNLQAQAPEHPLRETAHQQAARLLNSPVPLDKAWGAYLVRIHGFADLTERMVEELNRLYPFPPRSIYPTPHESLGYALVDTLIQLRAEVPARTTRDYFEAFPVESIMLASRSPAQYEDLLLEWREQDIRPNCWLAAGNLLAGIRSSKFTRALLDEGQPLHRFVVIDHGVGYAPGEGGAVSGCRMLRLPAQFPPIAVYELTIVPEAGDIQLASGPTPVYYRRIEVPTGRQVGWSDASAGVDKPQAGVRYLAFLAGVSEADARWAFSPNTTLGWRDADTFSWEAGSALDQQRAAIGWILGCLERESLIDAREAASRRIAIKVNVEDRRRDQSIPLPEIVWGMSDIR